jgi:hypothetical protein
LPACLRFSGEWLNNVLPHDPGLAAGLLDYESRWHRKVDILHDCVLKAPAHCGMTIKLAASLCKKSPI